MAEGNEGNGRAFNEWLRIQLRVKKMSQRQLAVRSGVDHSTISRLIRGDRTPSLGTATKLARGLREIPDEQEATRYFGVVETATANPVARVEYALRADEALTDPQVRWLMEYYLAFRVRGTSRPNPLGARPHLQAAPSGSEPMSGAGRQGAPTLQPADSGRSAANGRPASSGPRRAAAISRPVLSRAVERAS